MTSSGWVPSKWSMTMTLRFTAEAPRNVPLILSATFGMFIYKAEAAAAPEEWFVSGKDAGTGTLCA